MLHGLNTISTKKMEKDLQTLLGNHTLRQRYSCIVSRDGSILDCSKDFLNILGYTSNEFITRSLFDFIATNNVAVMFESLESRTKIQLGKIILRKKDGTYISFSALIRNSTFRSKPVVVLVFRANNDYFKGSGGK